MSEASLTITQNKAECLRDVYQFGGTDVHNVCSGAVHWLPWGMADWLGVSLILLFLLAGGFVLWAMLRT